MTVKTKCVSQIHIWVRWTHLFRENDFKLAHKAEPKPQLWTRDILKQVNPNDEEEKLGKVMTVQWKQKEIQGSDSDIR